MYRIFVKTGKRKGAKTASLYTTDFLNGIDTFFSLDVLSTIHRDRVAKSHMLLESMDQLAEVGEF
jgi:hypothetical protein